MRDYKIFLVFIFSILVLFPISTARFIQPDSLIADVYDPQNLNRYSYALNNPYKFVDETGNYAVEIGPQVKGTLGILTPIGVAGISGVIGEGLAVSYVPGEGFQAGTFHKNAIGTGVGAKIAADLLTIYPDRETSVSDLGGQGRVLGVGGGKGPIGGSLQFAKGEGGFELQSIGIGVGAVFDAYAIEQATTVDIFGDKVTTNPRGIYLGDNFDIRKKINDEIYYYNPPKPEPKDLGSPGGGGGGGFGSNYCQRTGHCYFPPPPNGGGDGGDGPF